MNWMYTHDYDTTRVTCFTNCWKWIKIWTYFEQFCGWIRLWKNDFYSNRMIELKPLRMSLWPGRSGTVMLCTVVDDFCRVLTSQSMLWRHCHVAEFVVWNLLAGEVHCRLHSPLKNCVKCWTFQTVWQCVIHRTLKLSVLQYQVSVMLSLRLLAIFQEMAFKTKYV